MGIIPDKTRDVTRRLQIAVRRDVTKFQRVFEHKLEMEGMFYKKKTVLSKVRFRGIDFINGIKIGKLSKKSSWKTSESSMWIFINGIFYTLDIVVLSTRQSVLVKNLFPF